MCQKFRIKIDRKRAVDVIQVEMQLGRISLTVQADEPRIRDFVNGLMDDSIVIVAAEVECPTSEFR